MRLLRWLSEEPDEWTGRVFAQQLAAILFLAFVIFGLVWLRFSVFG